MHNLSLIYIHIYTFYISNFVALVEVKARVKWNQERIGKQSSKIDTMDITLGILREEWERKKKEDRDKEKKKK